MRHVEVNGQLRFRRKSSSSVFIGLPAVMNEKIYIARLKAYKCMLNLPRLTEN